jgi:hypothetical protein
MHGSRTLVALTFNGPPALVRDDVLIFSFHGVSPSWG